MRLQRLPAGFTLIELVVVLVVLGMSAVLVAPTLRPPTRAGESDRAALLRGARDLAVRRAESLRLEVQASGAWVLTGTAPGSREPLASGRLGAVDGPGFALVFSPLGTCGPDPASRAVRRLDPLRCELRGREP